MNFLTNTDAFSIPFGSSASIIADQVYLIGGIESGKINENPFLQLRVMNIFTAEWVRAFVDTNAIVNRLFHVSVTMKDKIYVFGGSVLNFDHQYNLSPTQEIFTIEKTIFGIKCTRIKSSPLAAKKGLSATCVGKDLSRVILFGGIQNLDSPSYSGDIVLFQDEEGGILKLVDAAPGEKPTDRAFHSSISFGDANQFVAVFGGQSGNKSSLNDVWILDLTEILAALDAPPEAAPPVPDKKAKPPPKGKAVEVKGPVAYWTKIAVSSTSMTCLPRHLHSSFGITSGSSIELFIFGGLGDAGPLPLSDVYALAVTVGEGKKFTASDWSITNKFTSKSSATEGNKKDDRTKVPVNLTTFGAAVVAIPNSVMKYMSQRSSALNEGNATTQPPLTAATDLDGESPDLSTSSSTNPACVFIFGGRRAYAPPQPLETMNSKQLKQYDSDNKRLENVSYMIAVEPNSRLVKKITRAVHASHPDVFAASSEGDKKGKNFKKVEFPDGGVYEGEVADILIVDATDDLTDDDESHELAQQSQLPSGADSVSSVQSLAPASSDVPHGQGTMQYADGTSYEGSWSNGERHGKGRYVDLSGAVYEGEFLGDQQTGKGKQTFSDGTVYIGDFVNGKFHGQGALVYGNGDRFTGRFEAGMKEGKGFMTLKENGTEQQGVWRQDALVGRGHTVNMSIECCHVHDSEAGLPFSLELKKTLKLHEIAERSTLSKGLYTGPIEDGLPSGEEGICKYQDGSEYRGSWRSGRRNGLGTFIFPNLDEYVGKWVGDRRCGFGRLTSLLGNTYEGNWDNNLQHGEGILHLKDGYRYVGSFVRGKRHGFGKLLLPNSENVSFEGQWLEDVKQQ